MNDEDHHLSKLFKEADSDGGGSLSRDEVTRLLMTSNMRLPHFPDEMGLEDFKEVIRELACVSKRNVIDFVEELLQSLREHQHNFRVRAEMFDSAPQTSDSKPPKVSFKANEDYKARIAALEDENNRLLNISHFNSKQLEEMSLQRDEYRSLAQGAAEASNLQLETTLKATRHKLALLEEEAQPLREAAQKANLWKAELEEARAELDRRCALPKGHMNDDKRSSSTEIQKAKSVIATRTEELKATKAHIDALHRTVASREAQIVQLEKAASRTIHAFRHQLTHLRNAGVDVDGILSTMSTAESDAGSTETSTRRGSVVGFGSRHHTTDSSAGPHKHTVAQQKTVEAQAQQVAAATASLAEEQRVTSTLREQLAAAVAREGMAEIAAQQAREAADRISAEAEAFRLSRDAAVADLERTKASADLLRRELLGVVNNSTMLSEALAADQLRLLTQESDKRVQLLTAETIECTSAMLEAQATVDKQSVQIQTLEATIGQLQRKRKTFTHAELIDRLDTLTAAAEAPPISPYTEVAAVLGQLPLPTPSPLAHTPRERSRMTLGSLFRSPSSSTKRRNPIAELQQMKEPKRSQFNVKLNEPGVWVVPTT